MKRTKILVIGQSFGPKNWSRQLNDQKIGNSMAKKLVVGTTNHSDQKIGRWFAKILVTHSPKNWPDSEITKKLVVGSPKNW